MSRNDSRWKHSPQSKIEHADRSRSTSLEETVSPSSTAADVTGEESSTEEPESTTSVVERLAAWLMDAELPSDLTIISTDSVITLTEGTESVASEEQSETADILDTDTKSNAGTARQLTPITGDNGIAASDSTFQSAAAAGTDPTDLIANILREQGYDSLCSSILGYVAEVTETALISTTATVSTPSVIFQVTTSTTEEAVTTEAATADATEDTETTETATVDTTDDAEATVTATADVTEDSDATGTATADTTDDAEATGTTTADATADATADTETDVTEENETDETAFESRGYDGLIRSLVKKKISHSPSSRKRSRHNKRQVPSLDGLSYLNPSLVAAACQKVVTQPTATGTVTVPATSTITSYEQVPTTVVGSTEIQTSFSTIIVARSGEGYKSVSE